jgi:hypothetical protein
MSDARLCRRLAGDAVAPFVPAAFWLDDGVLEAEVLKVASSRLISTNCPVGADVPGALEPDWEAMDAAQGLARGLARGLN